MKVGPKHHISAERTPPTGKPKELFTGALAALKIFTAGVQSLKGHVAPKKASKEDQEITLLAQKKMREVSK